MAQTVAIILFTIFSLSLFPWTSTCFSLELTHRDSPLSPLYQSNLSDSERFMKNIEISKARASYLEQQSEIMDGVMYEVLSTHLPLRLIDPLFTVEIGIGTPAAKKTLIFDTGSSLTWTQCSPCTACFRQNEPLLDPKKSTSCKNITKTHPLAKGFKCSSSGCIYRNAYQSGQRSVGPVATESFTFGTNAPIPNLALGCGTNNTGLFPPQISGLLGMDKSPTSFVLQLGSTAKGRFSYCLSSVTTKVTHIKFGDDAMIRGSNPQRTPFKQASTLYALKLNDLTFCGQKLGVGSIFSSGSCYIDSGSTVSFVSKKTYSDVTNALDKYFAGHNIKRYVRNKVKKGYACYEEKTKISNFPSLTFNFEGANFDVPYQNMFRQIDSSTICLQMKETVGKTIFGAFQ